MSKAIEKIDRARKVGRYIVDNNATVTQTAKEFGISIKSVRWLLNQWLRYVDKGLYIKATEILDNHAKKKWPKKLFEKTVGNTCCFLNF